MVKHFDGERKSAVEIVGRGDDAIASFGREIAECAEMIFGDVVKQWGSKDAHGYGQCRECDEDHESEIARMPGAGVVVRVWTVSPAAPSHDETGTRAETEAGCQRYKSPPGSETRDAEHEGDHRDGARHRDPPEESAFRARQFLACLGRPPLRSYHGTTSHDEGCRRDGEPQMHHPMEHNMQCRMIAQNDKSHSHGCQHERACKRAGPQGRDGRLSI